MSKPMNLGLQKYLINKLLQNCGTVSKGEEWVELVDGWADQLDEYKDLPGNIDHLKWLKMLPDSINEEKEEMEYQIHQQMLDLRDSISSSLYPIYHCGFENCLFEACTTNEMIEHLLNEHDIDIKEIPTEPVKDFDYIILAKLVSEATKDKSKSYIRIANKELCELLNKKLGDGISNQKPRQILKTLGLLSAKKYQKVNNLGYDKKGNRVYHINIKQLKEVVRQTKFNDLKIKMAVELEPPSPTSKSKVIISKESDEKENKTYSFDDWL